MKIALTLAAVVGLAVVFVGCDYDDYKIVMTPRDGGMDRELTVGRTNSQPASAAALEALTTMYATSAPATNKATTFRDHFAGKIPSNLGSGWTIAMTSPMGSVQAYSERVGGVADQAGVIERRFKAVDELVNLIGGFVGSEFKQYPEAKDLQKFIQGQMRKDLKNLSLNLWMIGIDRADAPQSRPHDELSDTFSPSVMRALQLPLDLGYLTPQDVKTMAVDEGANVLPVVVAGITRKANIKDSRLAALLTAEAKDWAEGKGRFMAYVKSHEQSAGRKEEQSSGGLSRLLETAFLPAGFGQASPDRAEFQLVLREEPLFTNGRWDNAKKCVTWNLPVPSMKLESQQTPSMVYAVWATPDANYQLQHLGRVFMTDKELGRYIFWYNWLTESDRKQWDAVMDKLRPADLETFRTTTAKAAHDDPEATKVMREGFDRLGGAIKALTQPAK